MQPLAVRGVLDRPDRVRVVEHDVAAHVRLEQVELGLGRVLAAVEQHEVVPVRRGRSGSRRRSVLLGGARELELALVPAAVRARRLGLVRRPLDAREEVLVRRVVLQRDA